MDMRSGIAAVVLLGLIGLPALGKDVDFAHDVLPILKKRCGRCHTNGTYEGRFSMDTRESLLRSKVVIQGKSGESDLLRRVLSSDPDERMPPKGARLSNEQVDVLRAWIDEGVRWQEGFSFRKAEVARPLALRPPELPKIAGLTHPIDRLLAGYYKERRVPAPQRADDRTFARRAYLDLVGVLPGPEGLEAFVEDAGAGDNGENNRTRLVDRLLERKIDYADHWITFWNDLLRNEYRGTGYIDGGRKQITSWLYRSLVDNKPYDQFVRELINPTAESEGFIKGIKWRGRVNASQVPQLQFAQNVSQVMLGINMKCASCHDSFIDHWTLSDAYGMAAIASDAPLEIYRCDKPTGETARAQFVYPKLGAIDTDTPRKKRLEQLAGLLTHKSNGRFSRTIVNRLWQRLLGRGLVHPVDVMRYPAWNDDVLDYLAAQLVSGGYDLKGIIRLITTSSAYQSESAEAPQPGTDEEYVFRGPIPRRLTAEQFLDAVWRLTGTGPKKPVSQFGDRQGTSVRASLVHADPLMRSLGRPNREQVVTVRPDQLTTLQALDLTNGSILTGLIGRGSGAMLKETGKAGADELARALFLQALCREPTPGETEVLMELAGTPITAEGVADLLWSIILLPEFLLVR